MKSKVKRRRTNGHSAPASSDNLLGLEAAATWRVFECLISAWWHDTTKLTHILVAKEPPFGGVVCCVFLVDLGCLGPKQALVSQFQTRSQYETSFRSIMMGQHPMISMEYPLAAKIILESLRYAQRLGFELQPQIDKALSALGPLDAAAECQQEIPLGGNDGRPFYIAGPDDDTDHIMATLIRTCGHGNFQFTIPRGPMPQDFFD